jgi:hypothetical protein
MHMTDTPGTPDRRKALRIPVALRVELQEGTGVTRDLSACGVFFETDCVFALGEDIQFAIILEHIDPCRPLRLQCRGQVVRVEQRGDTMGVAVVITAYQFDTRAHRGVGALCKTAY